MNALPNCRIESTVRFRARGKPGELSAYEQIGCPDCAEILRLSLSLFPEPGAQVGRDERVEFVENHRELFEPLDNRFWECDT